MGRPNNLTGQVFGRLTALRPLAERRSHNVVWHCICTCGVENNFRGSSLASGNTKSCGCLSAEKTSSRRRTHGKSRTKEYWAWFSMKNRCNNPAGKDYPHYGGRGIKICVRWQKFENFLADVGECPPGMSLDRIDNNGNYTPSNCRWATRQEQQNNRRNNRWLVYNGRRQTIAAWSRELGISPTSIYRRSSSGWPIERVLEIGA